MALLEILSPSGRVRKTELNAGKPLSIGRSASSDVRVDADGVAPLHCRISWDGDGYSLSSGTPDGVEVNGRLRAEAQLKPGDVLRIGPANFTFRDPDAAPGPDGNGSAEIGLAPLSEEELPTFLRDSGKAKAAVAGQKAAAAEKARGRADAERKAERARQDAEKQARRDAAKRAAEKQRVAEKNSPRAAASGAAATAPPPAADAEPEAAAAPKATRPAPPPEAPAADPDDDFDDANPMGGGLAALAALAGDDGDEDRADPLAALAEDAAGDGAGGAADDDAVQPVLLGGPREVAGGPAGGGAGLTAHIRRLGGPPKRPGEQEVVKSPLVLWTAGGVLTLAIAALALWLLIGRDAAQQLYDAAEVERESGRFTQAVQRYEQFLTEFPTSPLRPEARGNLGRSRVERQISGSNPNWPGGVLEIDRFVRENRDSEEYPRLKPELAGFARRTALGAAAAAERSGIRPLLDAGREAGTLHARFADPEEAGTAAETEEIATALARAERAVVKAEAFGDTRAAVAQALGASDFAAAHRARVDLVDRYRSLGSDRDVIELRDDTLAAEREAAVPIPAADDPPPEPAAVPPALSVAFVDRVGGGSSAGGRAVTFAAGASVTASDVVTGDPLWRAAVGPGGSFPPVAADASVPVLLVVDEGRGELTEVDRTDGRVRWRLPLGAAATGPPLVTQGQAVVGTAGGRLLRVDLETGRVLGGVRFARGVLSPPAALSDGRLLVVGERDVTFTLDGRSFEVSAASFTGHGAGSVAVAPQALGTLVLLCDNDRTGSCRLRTFAVGGDGRLDERGGARVAGRVTVPPTQRGDRLFVASTPERFTAFAASDAADRGPLQQLAASQVPDARDVPTFLTAGPDGLLWAAGSALRKLQLEGDTLSLTPEVLAPGRHVAAPQTVGDDLFTSRLVPATGAAVVSAAAREEMVSRWRTTLAVPVLAVTGGGDGGSVAAVTGDGRIVRLSASAVAGGGFVTDGRTLPNLADAPADPLRAARLPTGTVAVVAGAPEPRVWEVDGGGRVPLNRTLSDPPQLPPAGLAAGVAVAVPGRVELVPRDRSAPPDPFLAPVGDAPPPEWRHLVALDETRLLAADAAGTLRVLQYRTEPSRHLAEAVAVEPGAFLDVAPAVAGDVIFAAFSDRTLRALGATALDGTASATLPAPAVAPPAASDDTICVATGDGRVSAFSRDGLEPRWSLELPSVAAGAPSWTGADWLLADRDGVVLRVAADGTVAGRFDTRRPPAGSIILVGETPVAVTADGEFVAIDFGEGE